MLAMAHVAGGDAMIGCFDSKPHFLSWRPIHAIHRADTDGNRDTVADPAWQPLFVPETQEVGDVPVSGAWHRHVAARSHLYQIGDVRRECGKERIPEIAGTLDERRFDAE